MPLNSGGPLYADDLRLVGKQSVIGDALDRIAHGKFRGLMGDHDDGLVLRRIPMLDNGFERDLVLGHTAGNRGEDAKTVMHGEADEVAALVRAHARALVGCKLPGGTTEHRTMLEARPAFRDISQVADHGGSRGIAT